MPALGKQSRCRMLFMNIGLVVSSRLLGSSVSHRGALRSGTTVRLALTRCIGDFPQREDRWLSRLQAGATVWTARTCMAQEATACAHLQNRSLQRTCARLWRLDGDQFAHGISPRCSDFWMPAECTILVRIPRSLNPGRRQPCMDRQRPGGGGLTVTPSPPGPGAGLGLLRRLPFPARAPPLHAGGAPAGRRGSIRPPSRPSSAWGCWCCRW
ncbi:Uncharacterised protein [Comamonas terrigena]|nr:Uncharacterised protein [Comamonas terrigena]